MPDGIPAMTPTSQYISMATGARWYTSNDASFTRLFMVTGVGCYASNDANFTGRYMVTGVGCYASNDAIFTRPFYGNRCCFTRNGTKFIILLYMIAGVQCCIWKKYMVYIEW